MIDDCRICMVFSQMFFPEFYDFVKRGNSFIDISGSVSSLHKFGTNPSQCGITNNLIRVQLVFLFCIDGLFDAFVYCDLFQRHHGVHVGFVYFLGCADS